MKEPAYKIIYNDIKSLVFSGKCPAGGRMDTEPAMAKHYHVSIGTVRKAVDYLVEEDVLRREQGRGTYVSGNINIAYGQQYGNGSKIKLAHGITLASQKEMDEALYGKNDGLESFSISKDTQAWPAEFDKNDDCDLIQISTIDLHADGIQTFFDPIPRRFYEKIAPFFKEQLLDEYRSPDGELLALPLTANMSVLYANGIYFKTAGLSIPQKSLSLDALLKLCRALKKHHEFPIALVPAPGCLYEPLMNICGCAYFDKRGDVSLEWSAFSRMMNFLKTLHSEKLCVNAYKIGRSYPAFVKTEKVCMIILNQFFNHLAENDTSDWHALPFPHDKFQSGCFTSIGLGVCKYSRNKEAAWNMLEQVFEKGLKRFANIDTEFPARLDLQSPWAGVRVKGEENFTKNLNLSEPIPARKKIVEWRREVYCVFQNAMEGNITVKNAWNNAKNILNKNQNRSVFNEAV
jgi:DNA-binding transcriptional regulator YhcF (GntR family)